MAAESDYEKTVKNELKIIRLIRGNLARLPSLAARKRVLDLIGGQVEEESQLALGLEQEGGD